jgi:two-component system, LuxR family, sensor kinase FixL
MIITMAEHTAHEGIDDSPSNSQAAPVPSSNRKLILLAAAFLFGLVVSFEWISELEFSLGVFYIFPIIVAALVLNRGWIVLLAFLSAFVRGQFLAPLATHEFWLRFAMATLAYAGVGLFVVEMTRNRRRVIAAYARLKLEKEMRHQAEDRLRMLADSSPAAIVTVNGEGAVIAANQSAHEMLGFPTPGTLVGENINPLVPLFSGALRLDSQRPIRTSASSWAKRANGVTFPVTTWFSTYARDGNRYLAGILVDTSEEVREREHENLRQMLDYNRLLAGAVSHEIRNMCLAIRVVTSNLSKNRDLAQDPDFNALTTLVDSLARIASFELKGDGAHGASWISLNGVFEQLRIVIEPDWNEVNGVIEWNLQVPSPRVYGNLNGLLQIFLNLSQNSLRAVQGIAEPRLEFASWTEGDHVVISTLDNGPGVSDESQLFQPFRANSAGSGLGLYISRTLAKSFGGHLIFVPTVTGCRFDLTLQSEPGKHE